MESATMISSIIGPIILLLWVWLLVNTKFYDGIIKAFIKERALVLVSWIWWAVAWILMVWSHNMWWSAPEIVVSLLWWIVLVKSALILAFPWFFMSMVEYIKYPSWVFKVAWIVYVFLGVYLTNLAYWMM